MHNISGRSRIDGVKFERLGRRVRSLIGSSVILRVMSESIHSIRDVLIGRRKGLKLSGHV